MAWRQPAARELRATWGLRRLRGPLELVAAAAEPAAAQVVRAAELLVVAAELLAVVAEAVWQLDSPQQPAAAAAWVAPRHPRR